MSDDDLVARVRKRMSDDGIPVGTDNPDLLALGARPLPEDEVPPPPDPVGLLNAIREVLEQAGDDDEAAVRGIRALLRVTP